MTGQKHTGSFYTPSSIAKFIIERVTSKLQSNVISMLEPSAGDGIFISEIMKNDGIKNVNLSITAVEIIEEEFKKIQKIEVNSNIDLNVVNNDFLKFQQNCDKKFDLILGNPPYIKKSLLSDEQSQLCTEINKAYGNTNVKNIWSSFLLSSFKLLKDDGIIALILPSEFLQVSYAKVLRDYLLDHFQKVEIFTFNTLIFESCKGQDTIILIAEKKSIDKGLFFFNINDIETQTHNINLIKHDTSSLLKWTSHVLDSSEIELIENLSSKLKKISDFCMSKTGIVTAANNFFIINNEKANELEINAEITKPIVSKSSIIPKGIVLNSENFDQICKKGFPSYLIDFNGFNTKNHKKITEYIKYGESLYLHQRYKMTKRNIWYEVPNVGSHSPVLFFKRCHNFPRIVKNDAKVLATDSAYLVFPNNDVDAKSLVFSFYNSLTLAMAEIQGRFYGGGVLELTPLEFKSLPLPYALCEKSDFLNLNTDFNEENDIGLICEKNDRILLKKYFPEIDEQTLKKLNTIRNKLVSRRQRL